MSPADQPAESHSRAGYRSEGGPLAGRPVLLRRQRAVQGDWDEVEEFLSALCCELGQGSCCVCLVSDRSMRAYNTRYRGIRKATDVLAFPAANHGAAANGYLGDIVISAETAQRNAAQHRLRLEDEIKALILHGVLHLLGKDHETDGGDMARAERRWGRHLGLPQTLLARRAS